MTRRLGLILSLALAAAMTAPARAQIQKEWQAPDIDKLADDLFGKSVRHGKALMEQTYKHIGPEVKDAKNAMAATTWPACPVT